MKKKTKVGKDKKPKWADVPRMHIKPTSTLLHETKDIVNDLMEKEGHDIRVKVDGRKLVWVDGYEESLIPPDQPRTHKPTKKEVPDDKLCWMWLDRSWKEVVGSSVRACWEHYHYWLPHSSLPDPRINQTTPRSEE